MNKWLVIGALVFLLLLGGGAILMAQGYKNGRPIDVQVKPIGGGLYLESSAADDWLRMVAAAKQAGFDLRPSGSSAAFRSSEQQTGLIQSRGSYGAGGYAAQPGYSPHQTGQAIDVACVTPGTPNFSSGLDAWLTAYSKDFNWYRVGLQFSTVEPWHLEHKLLSLATSTN